MIPKTPAVPLAKELDGLSIDFSHHEKFKHFCIFASPLLRPTDRESHTCRSLLLRQPAPSLFSLENL